MDCSFHLKELWNAGKIDEAAKFCSLPPCSEVELCQRFLGRYYFGRGDLNLSFAWYQKAALQGSQQALDECWKVIRQFDARGNKSIAMKLCAMTPCSEYVKCQRYLVKAFFDQRKFDETLRWSIKIAEHGNADDLLYVALIYRSRNESGKALKYFERAAVAGSTRAYQLIGDMYAFGIGVSRDIKLATDNYARAAAAGFLYAKARLLHLEKEQHGFLGKLIFVGALPLLIIQATAIRIRNPKDMRLTDIPGWT